MSREFSLNPVVLFIEIYYKLTENGQLRTAISKVCRGTLVSLLKGGKCYCFKKQAFRGHGIATCLKFFIRKGSNRCHSQVQKQSVKIPSLINERY